MTGEYGIWLSWNNRQEEFALPILPKEVGTSLSGDGSEHDVSGLGKINVIKDRGLGIYRLEGMFPARPYPFMVSDAEFKEPRVYVDYIMRWWDSKRPIRLVIVTETMEVNTAASIEAFEWREEAGSPGDILFSLELKEYKFYGAKRLPVQSPSEVQTAGAGPRPDDRVPPKTYTLQAGDNLWKVAQKILGDGSSWREIQRLNGITDAEIRRLPVGKVLKLP